MAGLLVSATAIEASTAFTIHDTGGGFATAGVLDPQWTETDPSNNVTTPFVTEGSPSTFPFTAWDPDDLPVYGWISPEAAYDTTSASVDAAGLWVFSTTFDLTGFDPTSAVITFKAAVDNSLPNSVVLNGHTVAIAGLSAVSTSLSSSTFTINVPADFVAGVNTLSFDVTNASGNKGNPVGLLVDFTSATANVATPEPGSAMLLMSGFAGMLVWARRRKRNNSK